MTPIEVRKARIGWWVNGRWCPTRAVKEHQIRLLETKQRNAAHAHATRRKT